MKIIKGLFTHPAASLGEVMEKKQWITAWIIMGVVVFLFSYVYSPIQTKQMAELMPEGAPIAQTTTSIIFGSLIAVIMHFILISLVALLVYIFFGIGGCKGIYMNYFALVMNAALVSVVLPALLNIVFLSLIHI